MSIIPCSAHCKYQMDGYCTLDRPTTVNNLLDYGCVHYIPRDEDYLADLYPRSPNHGIEGLPDGSDTQ